MTKIGPFAELARIIEVWLSNQEETAFVLVTLAEELPINECLHFLDELEADRAHLGAIVFNRLRRSPVPNVPAWPEVAKELTTLERPNLDAIVSLIEAGVNESEIQLVRLKNLQKTLADRFQLSPRVSTAFEETSGLDTIADALVSLGQSQ
jgi:anion-transporting  ArsA/GET3 family ATPase